MRLGGPIFGDVAEPERWAAAVMGKGYRAAMCPVKSDTDEETCRAYVRAAEGAGITIAEVGAWSNPISRDEAERKKAIIYCQKQLELADRIGARCCVNIAGSRGPKWDGPHPDNLTAETFDLIVETTRDIIDAVKPTRTFFTLETMPWVYPDSPDSYVSLIHAIDRKQFGVHLDPVNMINSPQRFYQNADFLRKCFAQLGPFIKNCHAKDIALGDHLTVHLDEVRPGLGGLDYRIFLQELNKLDPDIPLLLEHLPNEQEYDLAAEHIRAVAQAQGIAL